jgi:hypothetical protein
MRYYIRKKQGRSNSVDTFEIVKETIGKDGFLVVSSIGRIDSEDSAKEFQMFLNGAPCEQLPGEKLSS